MRRLSDKVLPLVEARLLAMGARTDLVEIDVEELGLVVALHCPIPSAYEAYIPQSVGPLRSSARFNLYASSLAYPCDEKGEPDLAALTSILDELPALGEDLHSAVEELASAAPKEILEVNASTMARCEKVIGPALQEYLKAHPVLRVVLLPEGSPVRAFAIKKPSRVAWDDYHDGSGVEKLCEKAANLCHDCIIGLDDKKRNALLKWAPALAIVLAGTLAAMAGERRRDPRKKARRGSSASSAPT